MSSRVSYPVLLSNLLFMASSPASNVLLPVLVAAGTSVTSILQGQEAPLDQGASGVVVVKEDVLVLQEKWDQGVLHVFVLRVP